MEAHKTDHQSNHTKPITLPCVNESGYYEIRLESIGGLGANLCGKLLGELGAAYLGLNAVSFSSYGSEKRGSPVKSHIRFCASDCDILHNSPVERPHLLVFFHSTLSAMAQMTSTIESGCTVVVNTPQTPEQIRDTLRLHSGVVGCVDALKLALERKSRVNMVMLGAIAKASGFIALSAVKKIVSDTLGEKYPDMLKQNLIGLEQGYHSVQLQTFDADERYAHQPPQKVKAGWGYGNAPLGGCNPHLGSTVSNDLSSAREGYIPLFLPEKCIHCGLCDSTCPDMVFQFLSGEYRGRKAMLNRGLDYHHCKGCMRCVDVCPTGALVAGEEQEHPKKRYFVRNKDLIAQSIDFEPTGADPAVTGESYLDEKRVDGGLM